MQIRHGEITLFEQLHQGFADAASGADHGDIETTGHGDASDEISTALYSRDRQMQRSGPADGRTFIRSPQTRSPDSLQKRQAETQH